jgi:hypothetical protein
MDQIQTYRRYAEECLAMAKKAREPAEHGLFLEMAAARHRLAAVDPKSGPAPLIDDASIVKRPHPQEI